MVELATFLVVNFTSGELRVARIVDLVVSERRPRCDCGEVQRQRQHEEPLFHETRSRIREQVCAPSSAASRSASRFGLLLHCIRRSQLLLRHVVLLLRRLHRVRLSRRDQSRIIADNVTTAIIGRCRRCPLSLESKTSGEGHHVVLPEERRAAASVRARNERIYGRCETGVRQV